VIREQRREMLSLRLDKLINLGMLRFWAASKAKWGVQLSRDGVMQPPRSVLALSCLPEYFATNDLQAGSASQSDCTR
jgi:hypothetical protein